MSDFYLVAEYTFENGRTTSWVVADGSGSGLTWYASQQEAEAEADFRNGYDNGPVYTVMESTHDH